jgi:hypothetical protein
VKNVKDEVYKALSNVSPYVTDSYPSDWVNLPAIQYIEDENKVYERTGNTENKAYVRYVIDVWHNKSTTVTTLAVDVKISELGLVRTSCKDVPDPSGLKHKHIVYEGIIDMNSDIVYWSN